MFELVKTIGVKNTLGEGVIWDELRECIWWTDIAENRLYRYELYEDRLQDFVTPFRLCSFGLIENDPRLIAAFDRGIAFYDYQTGAVEWLACPEKAINGNRLNDGKIDCAGRFWVGSMQESPATSTCKGSLYCLDGLGQLTMHESEIGISNGICWSKDNGLFYLSDSSKGEIYVYDFDAASPAIDRRRVYAQTGKNISPDGASVDGRDRLWSAHWGGGQVVCYGLEGGVDMSLVLSVSQPSCVGFAGQRLDLLCITSAREGLSGYRLLKEPLAGDLFIYQTDVQGLPGNRFKIRGSG